MGNNKQLQGSEMFWYFVNHFGMDYSEALYEMDSHGQDTKSVRQMLIAQNFINKQKRSSK